MSLKKRVSQLSPLKQAFLKLKQMQAQLDAMQRSKSEPIAIIGMGCRLPGGVKDAESYWQLLKNGVDAISEVPPDRWDIDAYYDPDPNLPGKMYTRHGGFLQHAVVDHFDPQFFGISPREAVGMDPQQRLLLEVSWEALEHASIAPETLRNQPVGVFVGSCFSDYLEFQVAASDPSRIDGYSSLGNFRSVAAGRIAYVLGLQGPTMQLDTACSSSLLAIHLAVSSLRNGECKLALAGGVNLMLSPSTTIGFCKLKALAPDGHCKTFDASANGYARGEGAGMILLKRLSDAQADGDPILALIRGSAVNHDGPSSGLTVPNQQAQEALIRQALKNGQIKAHEVSYVEAHGTGTLLGDPIEVDALGAVYGKQRKDPLMIGSVKTNMGHLESAAGIAGVMKVVLALQHKEIPPHLNFSTPNPNIAWQTLPMVVPTEATKWPKNRSRVAGVSSFGMSGTNTHVILEEAPPVLPSPTVGGGAGGGGWPNFHLLCLSAKTEAALQDLIQAYASHLTSHPELNLADICFTANTGRSHFQHRLSVIAQSTAELRQKLLAPTLPSPLELGGTEGGREAWDGASQSEIAFFFTGQGSHAEHMRIERELYDTQPIFRQAIDRCNELLRRAGHPSVPELVEGNRPRLFAFEYALAKLWQSWGIMPTVVMGYGIGEIVAACVAGVLSLDDALKLSATSEFEQTSGHLTFNRPRIEIISSLTGQIAGNEIAMANYWAHRGRGSVHVADGINMLHEQGYEVVEIGPLTPPSNRGGTSKFASWAQLLRTLGSLYERGVKVDWQSFYQNTANAVTNNEANARQRVVLPTYPFQRERYWVPETKGAVRLPFDKAQGMIKQADIAVASPDLPLLGQRLRLPFSNDIRFETHFRADSPAFLDEHRLFGTVIVPAASHLSMVLSAIHEALPQDEHETEAYCLEDCFFSQTLILPEEKSSTVQLVIMPNDLHGREASFQIVSLAEGKAANDSASWSTHATGRISRQSVAQEWVNLAKLEARCQEPLAGHEFYERFWAAGYHLGPSFRWNEMFWLGEASHEAFGELNLPDTSHQVDAYRFYPGFIDSCFHAILAHKTFAEPDNIYVPFSIERVRFGKLPALGTQLYCHAQIHEEDDSHLRGDLRVFEQSGRVIGEIIGLTVRKASSAALLQTRTTELDEWLYEVVWQADEPETAQMVHDSVGHWLIVTDNNGIGIQLAQLLDEQGGSSVIVHANSHLNGHQAQINLTDPQAFLRLFHSIKRPFTGILYLCGLNQPQKGDLFENTLSINGGVLHLLQALEEAQIASGQAITSQLWLVTQGAQWIIENQEDQEDVEGVKKVGVRGGLAAQQTLWGLGRVIRLEYPNLSCVCVDLDPSASTREASSDLLAALLASDESQRREEELAFRHDKRYVSRLSAYTAPHRDNRAHLHDLRIKADGSYLITGGLGSLGLELAQWLLNRGAGHLVLSGRRGSIDAAVMSQLEEAGAQISVVQADITQPEEVTRLLTTCASPLRGIIHAAGVLDDGILTQQSLARFEKVMAPKVQGAWNLHTLTEDKTLDFFVLFSSTASLLGSAGQANYAAANAFMDGLAHYRRRLGLPALSINWGPWNVGMAAQLANRFKAQGLEMIPASRGLQLLGQLLKENTNQVAVLPVIDWANLLIYYGNRPFFEMVAPTAPSQPQAGFLSQLEAAPADKRDALLLTHVRHAVAQVLGLSQPQKISARQRLFDLGLDSLMAIELKNKLESDLKQTLPATLLFDYPTVEALHDYLASQLLPASTEVEPEPEPEAEEIDWDEELEEMSDLDIEMMLLEELDKMEL